ncbi:MAG: hypothetical protein KGL18_04485 [Burkholderiales bacterium]|nr:hypothetical protein [Burkholderiales bacterium]MDE1929234.1 hypothetical protein [Burkholderiales bacterium]MDE2161376.1 hypothetical protein [Burkholderiales bacterium]MDE2502223.1 hypothetical protein [Burkholderiales bacterium]
MIIVAIAWIYVVLMAAIVEASSSGGTLLGAGMTFIFWGLLPLAIVLYIMGTPARRRARRRAASEPPDSGSHAPGDTVAPEREEA